MEKYRAEYQRRRNRHLFILKITIILLAATILATGVTLGVMLATDAFSSRGDGEELGENDVGRSIRGPEGDCIYLRVGDKGILYESFVTTTGAGELEVDSSDVNLRVAGEYKVYYTFGDLSYVLTVRVRPNTFTQEQQAQLDAQLSAIIQQNGWDSYSKVKQVQAVYAYVHTYIPWNSDAPSNVKTAQGNEVFTRDAWQQDWQEEAYLTLKHKKGDCYSYYALSKAFFEKLGIENLGIRRSTSSKEAGTHFWNIVNVGTKDQPKWYYYDSTELGGSFTGRGDNGCLLTQAELDSYVTGDQRTDHEFYKVVVSEWEKACGRTFPKIATEKIPVA